MMVLNMDEVVEDVISIANRVARFTGVDEMFTPELLLDP